MKKPDREVFERFEEKYTEINKKCGKDQYLVTFLMSSHPGCTLKDMIETAEYIRDTGRLHQTGTGLHPNPHDFCNLHVPHRT